MSRKRLSAAEFDHAVASLRRSMSETNVAIGRAVLVDGRMQTDLCSETGQTPQAINNILRRIWNSHVEHTVTPDGWERVTVCLPKALATAVKQMEKDALASLANS